MIKILGTIIAVFVGNTLYDYAKPYRKAFMPYIKEIVERVKQA